MTITTRLRARYPWLSGALAMGVAACASAGEAGSTEQVLLERGDDAGLTCEQGTPEHERVFTPARDGSSCATVRLHCVTQDPEACPHVGPLPSDFCPSNATLELERQFDVTASDGLACIFSFPHCITRDPNACPFPAPHPPDFCAGGTIHLAREYGRSSDGLECSHVTIHCVRNDPSVCRGRR